MFCLTTEAHGANLDIVESQGMTIQNETACIPEANRNRGEAGAHKEERKEQDPAHNAVARCRRIAVDGTNESRDRKDNDRYKYSYCSSSPHTSFPPVRQFSKIILGILYFGICLFVEIALRERAGRCARVRVARAAPVIFDVGLAIIQAVVVIGGESCTR